MEQNEIKGGGAGPVFDYGQVDDKVAEFLREKEFNIREIERKAYLAIASEFYEAQQELAGSRYDGVFYKWIDYMRYKKSTVYELITIHNSVIRISDTGGDVGIFNSISKSLAYEIAKPSAESSPEKAQAKAEVLSGEIGTHKKYLERIAELEAEKEKEKARTKQAEQAKLNSDARAERAERDADILRDTLESIEDKEPKVRTEYVYVEKELDNQIRKIDVDERKEFYSDFINELDFIRGKFGAVALEGSKLREAIEYDDSLVEKLNDFDDFWKAFSKSIFKNNTIIEMG